MKLKRILSAIAATAMLAGCITSCGTEPETNKPASDPNTKTDDNTKKDETPAGDGEKVELTMWSISTESDAFHNAYTKAIEDFEASHPGVTVKHETFENESYKTKIKAAVAANELPDVFFSWAGGFSQSFVDSGKVLCLDDYYSAYSDQISMAALGNLVYDGKLYGSVMCTPVSCMWYNKRILDENGLKCPETWEDFETVCKTLIDNKITPIATSAKDTWVLAMLHDGLTLKSAGPDLLYKTLKKQGGSYSDPAFLESAKKIQELNEMGAFINGASGLSNDEASQEFYAGNAAMYFTGSWMGGSIVTDCGDDAKDFAVAPIPVINSTNAKITDFMGGGSDSLLVAESTQHKELAAQLAFEITRGVSKYGYMDGAGIPAWKVDYEANNVPELMQSVAEYATGATSFTLWFDTLLESEDANIYLELLQKLFVGTITPEDFQKEMAAQLEK